MRFRSIALLALLALAAASCGGGAPMASGPSEGIQIHGDWTIDVFNEDGSLDQRVEFSNHLTASGADLIASVLSRTQTPGSWRISAHGEPTGNTACGTACIMDELLGNLTVTTAGGVLSLMGSFEATQDGNVGVVQTRVTTCTPEVAPASCSGGHYTEFTHAAIDPQAVSTGQSVKIQVDLSFTAG